MAVTDQAYQLWLRRADAQKVLLVELHHSAGVEYIANRPFVSQPTDSLPNQPFNDLLSGAVDVTSRIDAQLAIGDLELIDDGSITAWATYKWRGYPVVMRLGDPAWSYDDFRVIAQQINAGLQSARRGQLVLGVYDAAAQLDKPLANRPVLNDKPVPLVLGSVLGVPAERISSQNLSYQVSWLPLSLLTVRDGSGPELSHTPDLANGQFTLATYTPRAVLCDLVEPHNTALSIVQWVADQYGLTLAPVSLPADQLGLFYSSEVTGRQILEDVCKAIGGYWQITLQGELRVTRLELPTVAQIELYADDILRDKIALVRTEEPWQSLKLNYARNYSPLAEVAGSINDSSPELANRLRTEWWSVTQTQNLPDYPLAPEQITDTALVTMTDVFTECARRLALRSQRREVWELEVFMVWSGEIVGQATAVHHPLLEGRLGRVISARQSPTQDRAVLEVWI